MKVVVIGTGYVGLVTGVCLAEYGCNVVCIDRDASKIALLQQHKTPIYEPGLTGMIRHNAEVGRLTFDTDMPKHVTGSDLVIIAVGTPTAEDSPLPDLHALDAATQEVAEHISESTLLVIKSTIPLGKTRQIKHAIQARFPEKNIKLASNPEFLREGSAIEDFMKPERIIIGVEDAESLDLLNRLYAPIVMKGAFMLATDYESAELIKYSSNALLATKVAFINEMADICEQFGGNIRDVSMGIGMDKRIGSAFLNPGPGFGGSCFPKDTLALAAMAKAVSTPTRIVEAVIESNDARKVQMAQKIIEELAFLPAANDPKGVAILGLTFKQGTDDMRESPALVIIPLLLEAGIRIRVYDPQGMQQAKTLLRDDNITWCNTPYEALEGMDAMAVLTEWNEFMSLDVKKIHALLRTPTIIDLRNIYKRQVMQDAGFRYVSIGRSTLTQA